MTISSALEEKEWLYALSTIVFLHCGMMARNNFMVTNISSMLFIPE
jgi:hypothetical protein